MPTIKLYLLGGFQVTRDGHPLTAFRSERARALFAYLALESNRPLTRVHLAKLFWGQHELEVARNNLRVTLSNLRQVLRPLDLIHATYHTVQFDASHPEFWCDLLALQDQIEALLQHDPPSPVTDLRELLQQEFLEGFERIDSPPFVAWLQQRRQRLRMLLDQLRGNEPHTGEIATSPPGADASRAQTEPSTTQQPAFTQTVAAAPPVVNAEWSGIPHNEALYGRQAELSQLRQWLVEERCRLIAILGMGGQGKTALAAHFVHSLAPAVAPHRAETEDAVTHAHHTALPQQSVFDQVLWCSLLNAPPLSEVLQGWIQVLSGQQVNELPASLDRQLDLVLGYLQRQRCLLVLDNVESILGAGERAGYYRPGYEDYRQLLERIAGYSHQSCLLLTSREQPHEMTLLQVGNTSVRTLRLPGMAVEAGQTLLQTGGLAGAPAALHEVVRRYSGNPLALKLVAVTIQELFGGSVAQFLAQETLVFDDIRDILDQHFARLAPLERDLLYWLAIEREPLPFAMLYENLVQPPLRREALEAMRSLQRRSLLEQTAERFYLQNVIIEYMTDRLVTSISQEIADFGFSILDFGEGDGESKIFHLNRYALVKAQAKEYVRETQVRLLLQPVADFLARRWSKAAVTLHLQQLLQRLRQEAALAPGYAAANLLHLLLQLQVDVRDYDFSHLSVWQAYLRGVPLPGVNFRQADLSGSVFTDPIGIIGPLAFSPDGEWLAASARGGQIYLWRTADQQVGCVLRRRTPLGSKLAFSPAPTGHPPLLASIDFNGTVSFWRVHETDEPDEPIHLLQTAGDEVTAIAFSPHAEASYLFACASSDQTIQVWEIRSDPDMATETGLCVQLRHSLSHPERVAALVFGPDGSTLMSSSVDHIVQIWDVGSPAGAGQLRQTRSEHLTKLMAVAFSPDGRLMASASADDYTVRLWDMATGQELHVLAKHGWFVGDIAFSPDSKRVATVSHDQKVRLWETSSGRLLHTLVGHTYIVWGVAFSPDGKVLASGGNDQTVRLWDVETGQPLHTLRGHPRSLRGLAYSAHQTLAGVGHDRLVHLWRLCSTAPAPTYQALPGHTDRLHAVAFSPDGCTLATAGADRTVRLWDVGAPSGPGQLLATLRGHTDVVYSLAFSPDNQSLASGGRDRMIHLWDVPSGLMRATLHGHSAEINGLAFHPAGRLLASASSDQTVRLWDLASEGAPELTAERVALPEYGEADGLAVAFSPDGTMLACSSTQLVFVWEMASEGKRQLCHMIKAHTNWVLTLAFSPDGHTLATAGGDMNICLWDLHSGQLLHKIQEDPRIPNAVVFSADGAHIFSANDDGTITGWDVASGQFLQTLRSEEPYAGMNITGATGITMAQKAALLALGAVESE